MPIRFGFHSATSRPRRRGATHRVAAAGVVGVVLACRHPLAAQQPLPSIEGKWRGMAGTSLDRIEIAFEFKRDSAGKLLAFLYQPVGNYYSLELPGAMESDSGRYVLRDYGLRLVPSGDSLNGSIFGTRVPVNLARSRTLPAEVPVPKLPSGPSPAWQLKLGAPVYASAALRDGIAYVGTSGGLFHAVNASTGKFVWTFSAGRPIFGAAAVTDSSLYFVCDNGYLFKLRRRDGGEVWRYDLGDSRVSRVLLHQVIDNSGEFDFDIAAPTPVLNDGVLYVGSGDGSMHAVDAESGKGVWRYASKGKIRSTASVDGDRVVFGTWENLVVALDRKTGSKLWEWDSHGPIVTSIVLVGDSAHGERYIVGNRYGLLGAVDPATGTSTWRMQMWGSSAESEATPAGGSLFYFGSSDLRRISLMDAADGRVLWRTDVYGWAWARPIVHGNLLLASTVGANPYQMRHLGALTAIDRSTGKIAWRWPMPELPGQWAYGFVAPAAVDDTHIVVGGLDGSLYGFPVK